MQNSYLVDPVDPVKILLLSRRDNQNPIVFNLLVGGGMFSVACCVVGVITITIIRFFQAIINPSADDATDPPQQSN